MPNSYSICVEEGYDITKEWIPVVPAQHYFMGGVDVDLNSHTSMSHLYASGETCCNGVHGANRLASNSLLESLVFAKSAAGHMTQLREKQGSDMHRFEENEKLPLEELAEIYDLTLREYEDTDSYIENNKDIVREAIEHEKRSLSDE